MSALALRDGHAFMEDVCLANIAAEVGTPTYIYSQAHFRDQYERLNRALSGLNHKICYAVKANNNLSVLRLFAELGAGFDIVSGGELERVLAAGGNSQDVVFSGVGKSPQEIDFALKLGIDCFNVESEAELTRLGERASLLHQTAAVSIRVNPDVDARTHPYISTGLKENKFGVSADRAITLYESAHHHQNLIVKGIDCHIGSQIAELEPMAQALDNLLVLIDQLAAKGIDIEHIDVGGGFGVTYQDEAAFDMAGYGRLLSEQLTPRRLRVLLEPGRYLVANGGVLLTQVEYLKPSHDGGPNFAVVDAAMNDLIRPALYQAWHDIVNISPVETDTKTWDIVGPVCESSDFLAKGRPLSLAGDDLLAVCSTGAYGMVQSSNYNARPRAAEVMVAGDQFRVIRRRETTRDLLDAELSYLS